MNAHLNAIESGGSRPAADGQVGMLHGLRAQAMDALRRLARAPRLWLRREQQRRALAGFDQRMLADIGLTPAERWQEARKPFWLA